MRAEQRGNPWEPSDAEMAVLSGFRLVRDTYQGMDEQMVSIRGSEAEWLLRKVGPLITARALREAAAESEAIVKAGGRSTAIIEALRARASSLSPDPKEGAA